MIIIFDNKVVNSDLCSLYDLYQYASDTLVDDVACSIRFFGADGHLIETANYKNEENAKKDFFSITSNISLHNPSVNIYPDAE